MFNNIIVYGTLRRGQHNYKRLIELFGVMGTTYKRTVTIPGYLMYDEYVYPYVVKSLNPDHKIIGEIFVYNDKIYHYIKEMEEEAGYIEDLVVIDDKFHSIFIRPFPETHHRIIESGDWVEYNNPTNSNELINFHY